MKKVVVLFGIHTLSFFHKLRHDLARELVVGFCSLILPALFYYVFNDFLNSEVQKISPHMRSSFGEFLAWTLCAGSAFAGGRLLRTFYMNPHSLFRSTEFLGEDPKTRRALGIFHAFVVFVLLYVPTWILIDRILTQWSSFKILISFLLMSVVSALASLLKQSSDTHTNHIPLQWTHSSIANMVYWRLYLLFVRNRLTQFCFFLFTVCTFVLIGAAHRSFPFVAAFAISFWSGFLGACALSFQFAEDLNASYIEKSCGVSHNSYLRTLFFVSLLVGFLLGFVQALVFFLITGENAAADALRIFFICATPMWVVPAVLFQIDGRRALISILTSFLTGLFLATAIYASWFALLLLPLTAYYGFNTQDGRFYRA